METARKYIKGTLPVFILRISSSSLWIYLWHILILYIVKLFIPNDSLWPIQYVLIVILSVFVTMIQNIIADWFIKKKGLKYFKVFKG